MQGSHHCQSGWNSKFEKENTYEKLKKTQHNPPHRQYVSLPYTEIGIMNKLTILCFYRIAMQCGHPWKQYSVVRKKITTPMHSSIMPTCTILPTKI